MTAATLELRHHTATRWRFRLPELQAADWSLMRDKLIEVFPPSMWRIRINPTVSTLVVQLTAERSLLPKQPLAFVYQHVVEILSQFGLTVSKTPLSPTEVMSHDVGRVSPVARICRGLANAVSVTLSLSTFLLSLIVFTVGFVGLFLPFSPGIWLMLFATLLFEIAIALRRPFLI